LSYYQYFTKEREYPKIGERAYARSPIFGLFQPFRDPLTIGILLLLNECYTQYYLNYMFSHFCDFIGLHGVQVWKER